MTHSFHDTRWTLVARSRGVDGAAKAALSELCEAYYAPVVAYLRRAGREEDAARELSHDFFASLLAADGAVNGADPGRGRFRSYLLGALKNFSTNQWDRAQAAKRGGGLPHDSLDGADEHGVTGAGLQVADAKAEAPDAAFDHQWALTVLARGLKRLETQMREDGKATHFHALKSWLTAEGDAIPQATAAAQLGMSAEAVKVAVHRLRKRFRDAVKAEIAQTVGEAGDVREELDALLAALRR